MNALTQRWFQTRLRAAWLLLAVLLLWSVAGRAASVGTAGYTNDFSAHPSATDWATLSITGTAGDAYTMDTEVNAVITSAVVTNRTTSAAGDPPTQLAAAVWASAGFYLQTRPTGNRYTVLLSQSFSFFLFRGFQPESGA